MSSKRSRDHMDHEGLNACLEIEIDLDKGYEEWMYTAHVFRRKQVPTNIVEPVAQKMMEKAQDNKNSSPDTPTSGSVGTRITRHRRRSD